MNKIFKSLLIGLVLILVVALSACNGTVPVPAGVSLNGTQVEPGKYVWSFEKATEATATGAPTDEFTPTPASTPTPLSSLLTPTGQFGSGSCSINGYTYTLKADSSAIWMDAETLKVLAQYGGSCEVVTVKEGWYWSVGDGTILHDSVQMERGNAFNATPGYWTFTYDAPATGTTNESLGLTFRDNLPKVDLSGQVFGSGSCTVDGQTYALASDSTAVWEDDILLRKLWEFGGVCSVTTNEAGWYWSTAGDIALDGQSLTNGQRLVAPIGTYTFTYEGGSEANGFTIRDNVPFGQ